MANEEMTPERAAELADKLMDEESFSKFWETIKTVIPPDEDLEGYRIVAQASWEVSRGAAIGIPLNLMLSRLIKPNLGSPA